MQLDDDDDIPIPPDNNSNQHQNSDLYEPENPTEEPENESDTELEAEQTKISDNSKENTATKTADKEGTDIENENETEKDENSEYDPEHETDTIPSNDDDSEVNDNNNKNDTNEKDDTTDTNVTKEKNDRNEQSDKSNEVERNDKITANKESHGNAPNIDMPKTSEDVRSLSPTLSDAKIPDADMTAANRKGVLELYDDSDWDELDIDRPKSIGLEKLEENNLPGKNAKDKAKEVEKLVIDKSKDTTAGNEKEEDRSYTPCLDEKNELEEGAIATEDEDEGVANDEGNTPDIGPTLDPSIVNKSTDKNDTNEADKEVGIGGLETELISDDEENDRRTNNRRRNEKRTRRETETFKKVSHKRKERNYRVEKNAKRNNRRRSSLSRSKSRSRSLTRSPTRSRSRSPKLLRRNRKRKSRTPLRSRSRSNDKENFNGGRSRFGFLNNRRFQRPLRPKRRELPRYDVRYVVGQQRNYKDRYGRDTSRPPRYSRSLSPIRRRKSFSRSRSRSLSPKRNRRNSFSISPSPQGAFNRRSPRRSLSPRLRRTHSPQRRLSSPIRLRSRSVSPIQRMNGRKVIRRIRNVGSPVLPRSGSLTQSPRYTPRLSHSRSISHSLSPKLRQKGKKKKIKDRKKKKIKKRITSKSPEPPLRRLSRQRDPYVDDLLLAPPKRKRHRSSQSKVVQSPHIEEPTWSPSPSPPPVREYDNNVSWTPPLVSPAEEFTEMHFPNERAAASKTNAIKKDKRKRDKKKKKIEKRRDGIRKEKRRLRRTETPEPLPSKEVFASGNNILVSVSFNKDAATQPPQQTTVVTLPPTREEVVSSLRRNSADRQVTAMNAAKKKKEKSHKRKKLDAKPVAIIDLERSPFQVHQEPTDVIVLTDSEGAHDDDASEHREHRDRLMSDSGAENIVHHHRAQVVSVTSGGRSGSHQDKTPPMLETIMEESYEIQQTGPKTPPEPPIIKFTLLPKKQNKQRNPLHEEPELNSIEDMEEEQEQQHQHQHRQEMESVMHMQNNQKIGPNTPPESGPCSPDVYDPFDPTKSPSMSPRSPTPPPPTDGGSQNSMSDKVVEVQAQKHISDEPRLSSDRIGQQSASAVGSLGNAQGTSTLNPVELVMALMNSKQQNNSQDIANKSIESQYSTSSSHMHTSSSGGAGHEESHGGSGMHDKSDEGISASGAGGIGITVLSNVLITTAKSQQSQHIPTISSPTPIPKGSQNLISKLPLPKIVAGSVGSGGSGIGLPSNSNLRNGGGADDSFNDLESPYSPGSADYEDLFEPPPDTHNSKRRTRRGNNKTEVFDNLFGSSSPVGHIRLPSYTPSTKKRKMAATGRKTKMVKGGCVLLFDEIFL